MINKCIVVTPAGRKCYLQKLVVQLEKQKNDFNEWHLWVNTHNDDDINFMKTLENQYDWIKCIYRDAKKFSNLTIHKFFDYTNCPDTVYIRLDDDIIWLEETFIKTLYNFRINNPQYFLVYGNIVNNQVIDHIHQRLGVFVKLPFIEYKCMGNSWKDGNICRKIHESFINSIKTNNLQKWKFSRWELLNHERVSINAIAWIGGSFDNFVNKIGKSEECWLSETFPKENNVYNVICGDALCVHYAFGPQRNLLTNDLLSKYD